jgi:hypothetical protein
VLLADLPAAAEGSPPPAADPAAAAAAADQAAAATADQAPVVYGDAAYGTGALLADLEQRGIAAMTKVAAPTAPAGALHQAAVPYRPGPGHGHQHGSAGRHPHHPRQPQAEDHQRRDHGPGQAAGVAVTTKATGHECRGITRPCVGMVANDQIDFQVAEG